MDNIVKQRLVGALILLALGVVFWPIIFVPEAERESPVMVEVMPAPPVDRSPLPEPDNIGLERGGRAAVQEQAARTAQDVSAPDDLMAAESEPPPLPKKEAVAPVAAPESPPPGKPALDEDGLPIAYTLQVATMGQKARAEKLRDELIGAGYKGYVKRLKRGDRVLYRVLVGPKYTREALEPIKVAVDKNWRVESLIMRYLP